ncbi:unnamed protein product, partial [Mesorhabditis belari]|uniref:Cytosolic fatty-acid binding proteins domain-containing protein n=1 Tax=Mesorhabditis belari TaxID=2138241 RepID=A0AAF3EJJ4_9BILA
MVDQLVGKWDLVSSEGFDEYLKEVGVGLMTRKIASNLKPTLIFEKNGDEWSMTSKSTFKTFTVKWVMDKEFDGETADGRKVKAKFSVDGDKLIQEEKGENGKNSRFERFLEDGKLKIVCESNGVKSVRVYERTP